MRLDGKVNASVDVISGMPLANILEPLLFILTFPSSFTLLKTIL